MLTSNRGVYPNKLVISKSDILWCLMLGVQNGPRVNNIYFIWVSLKIGGNVLVIVDNQRFGGGLE